MNVHWLRLHRLAFSQSGNPLDQYSVRTNMLLHRRKIAINKKPITFWRYIHRRSTHPHGDFLSEIIEVPGGAVAGLKWKKRDGQSIAYVPDRGGWARDERQPCTGWGRKFGTIDCVHAAADGNRASEGALLVHKVTQLTYASTQSCFGLSGRAKMNVGLENNLLTRRTKIASSTTL